MLKYSALLCLFLQFFSLTAPVAASVVAVKTDSTSSTWVEALLSRPAQVHQLAPGETTAMVAERLGLTLSQLQTYNQFRTFNKPFARLSTGDELDIPASGTTLSAQTEKQTPASEKTGNNTAAHLAGRVSSLAGMAASGDKADAAAGAARSAMTGAVSQTVEQWLGQFGTVQAQLSMNDDWRLEDSSIDWLVPLYETPDHLLFTQMGWRNKDDRNTLNMGMGMRLFTADSMIGMNSFYDADITGDNRRLGMGLEYWRDYVNLSANGYYRLTDWHQSMDFADYDERPANGWDIRLNGWLPAYPQIGGKLMYEKYYGEEVALFGSDARQRQKNPYAVTAGVNWTPFPLMTVGLDHRAGENGQNDTSLNLQLTWKPDEPWGSQVSPSEVDGMRRLSGSRHNLVDRNNDIVLEYRKQVLIKSSVGPSAIKDVPGSAHTVVVQVNSKYPLQGVNWDNAAFLEAGGTFTQTDMTRVRLTLPVYQVPQLAQAGTRKLSQRVAPVSNLYVLTATAVDRNGNRGTPQELIVEVLPPQLSFSGELAVTGDGAPADGKTPVTVTATVLDSNNAPFAGQTVNFTAPTGNVTASVVTDANGHAMATMTSTVAGKTTVTATTGSLSKAVDVTFVDTSVVASRSSLTVSPDIIMADGVAFSTLSLAANNQSGQPQVGLKDVTFRIAGVGGTSVTQTQESSPGVYTARLSGTQVGQVQVTPVTTGITLTELTQTVALTSNGATAGIAVNDLSVVTNGAKADGMSQNSVKVVVTDAQSNRLAGQTVRFTADNGAVIGIFGTTDANGEVSMTLKSITSGNSKVTATINSSTQQVTVNFVAGDADTATSSIASAPLSVTADGISESIITLTLKDIHSNVVMGQSVVFSSSLAGSFVGSATDNGDGTYTAALTGRKSGTTNITVQVNGRAFGVTPAVVTLRAGNPDVAHSIMAAGSDSIVADGNASSRLTITLKDVYDNLVTGQTVVFISSLPGTTVGNVADNGDGTYTADLTGTSEGVTSITAMVNGNAFGVPVVSVNLVAVLTLTTNGKTYSATAGFPQTGFRNANFQILLNGNVPANYTWSSNRPWVQVNSSGKVTLSGIPSAGSKTVTLTGTPDAGGTPQVYTFTVNSWFTTPGSTKMTGNNGSAYCSSQGAVQFSSDDWLAVTGDWGGLNAYGASDFGMVADSSFMAFTSTNAGSSSNPDHRWIRDLFLTGNSDVSSGPDASLFYVTCRTDI